MYYHMGALHSQHSQNTRRQILAYKDNAAKLRPKLHLERTKRSKQKVVPSLTFCNYQISGIFDAIATKRYTVRTDTDTNDTE